MGPFGGIGGADSCRFVESWLCGSCSILTSIGSLPARKFHKLVNKIDKLHLILFSQKDADWT